VKALLGQDISFTLMESTLSKWILVFTNGVFFVVPFILLLLEYLWSLIKVNNPRAHTVVN